MIFRAVLGFSGQQYFFSNRCHEHKEKDKTIMVSTAYVKRFLGNPIQTKSITIGP